MPEKTPLPDLGTDGRAVGAFGEGTWARKFDVYPITGEEAQRLARISNALRVLHVNGCIHDTCQECDLIAEMETLLVKCHGRYEMEETQGA